MSTTEKLIDEFLAQVEFLGGAPLELQERIATLLRSKRAILLAKAGRPRSRGNDRRDGEIYQAYMELRQAGSKVKDIEQALGEKYSVSPERIKSIMQDWNKLI